MNQRGDMRLAALLYGNHPHHLDHLAPLCYFLKIPLILHDAKIYRHAKEQYPHVDTRFISANKIIYVTMQNYDVLISCFTRHIFQSEFALCSQALQKTIKNIWCPHGFSDKGIHSYLRPTLSQEKVIITYGDQGKCLLKSLTAKVVMVGNYRLRYFQEFHSFYQKLLLKRFPKIKKLREKKIIFFAPTWDQENSLFSMGPSLIQELASTYHLLLKPHPNSLQKEHLGTIYQMTHHKNVTLIDDFFPIYPLLDKADIYLGDSSSIGYDFLYRNRPMFFFTEGIAPSRSPLLDCGVQIIRTKKENIFSLIEESLPQDQENFSKKREKLYDAVFTKNSQINTLCHDL